MFKKIFGRFMGGTPDAAADTGQTAQAQRSPPASPAQQGAPTVSAAPPLAPSLAATLTTAGEENPAQSANKTATYLCREPILNEEQRIVAYLFSLQETTHQHIRHSSRRLQHLYAEILVGHLLDARIDRLLGQRLACIEIPDSFLSHPLLDKLPAQQIILLLAPPLSDTGNLAPETLLHTIRQRQAAGFRIGLPDPLVIQEYAGALASAQFIALQAPTLYPNHCTRLRQLQAEQGSKARWLVRDLPALEDFRFAHKMGGSLFHGEFITRREEWGKREPGPDTLRIANLLAKVRADGDTKEIAQLLKQDAALSLRLLRYVNSAAYQPQEPVTSIEHALLMFGRERLYRWLILLACAPDANNGRTSAALEIALVRARMLELLGGAQLPGQSDSLFLVGLLSLADIVLQVPLAKAIAPLSLADDVRAALLDGNGPYAPYLELALACEQGFKDPQGLQNAAALCRVSPEQATDNHLEALNWAMEVQS